MGAGPSRRWDKGLMFGLGYLDIPHNCPRASFYISSLCIFLSTKLTPVVHFPFLLRFNIQLRWATGWDIYPVSPLERAVRHCFFSVNGQIYSIKLFHIPILESCVQGRIMRIKGVEGSTFHEGFSDIEAIGNQYINRCSCKWLENSNWVE